jgi:hypothetical protein
MVAKGRLPQTISLKAECSSPKNAGGDTHRILCSDAVVGEEIKITAKADSGLPVSLTITYPAESVTVTAFDQYSFTANMEPGGLIVDASQAGSTMPGPVVFAPAPPMRLEIGIQDKLSVETPAFCKPLGQPIAHELAPHVDAETVAAIIGESGPFIATPEGKRFLAIYGTRRVQKAETSRLEQKARDLASHTPQELGVKSTPDPIVSELEVPHAVAFGDLAQKFSNLGGPKFKIEDVGSSRIRITIPADTACGDWSRFLEDLRQAIWNIHPEPFSTRLFFTSALSASAALGSGGSFPGSVSVAPLQADFLIFGDPHPGDDSSIAERNRIIATFDLPRPEMEISAWILQNSSVDPQSAGNFNDIVQHVVSANNDAVQRGIFAAWSYLRNKMEDSTYFDKTFYQYISGRFAANLPTDGSITDQSVIEDQSSVTFAHDGDRNGHTSGSRKELGYCKSSEYCLGYTDIFSQLQPRLTDLLLAVVAADSAECEAVHAAMAMELQDVSGASKCGQESTMALAQAAGAQAKNETGNELHHRLLRALDLKAGNSRASFESETDVRTCEGRDLGSLVNATSTYKYSPIKLNCFKDVAISGLLADKPANGGPTPLGLIRAAVADFLFYYKASQQYPHEFSAYDLKASANTLNSALRPFVDAFHRDVVSYQRYLGALLQVQIDDFNEKQKSWLKSKPFFVNNGIVTVRTISGQNSTMDVTSQSFLDASSAPQVSQLAQAILGLDQASTSQPSAASTPATTTTTTTITPAQAVASNPTSTQPAAPITPPAGGIGRLIENLSPNQAQLILAALSAYQSSRVQIGRELSLDVSPNSLSGAQSAEIQVKFTAGEPASPTYFSGPQAGNPADISRVSNHSTSTRVRVDSIKFFDVSSYSAVVQKQRSRFPLVPPFVEIPYIGSVIGIPLPPSTEYHSSTALISALILPTATDLVAGIRFRTDEIVDPSSPNGCIWPGESGAKDAEPCRLRRAVSLKDLNKEPIIEYHHAMVRCLATSGKSSHFSLDPAASDTTCSNLTFHDVIHDSGN